MYAGAGGGRRTNSSSTPSPTSEIPGTDGGRRYVLHPGISGVYLRIRWGLFTSAFAVIQCVFKKMHSIRIHSK